MIVRLFHILRLTTITAALQLFNQIWPEPQPVRLIGVEVSGLGMLLHQLSLRDAPSLEDQARQTKVRATLESSLPVRFGAGNVWRGSELGEEER